MLRVKFPIDMRAHVGQVLGTSDWVVIDQAMIDLFAQATGDHQWIHLDVDRAKREMPGGKTIAHGYLLVSLIPRLAATIFQIEERKRSLNYGSNKVRFIHPVPEDSRVRLRLGLKASEPIDAGGERLTFDNTLELENSPRPALVAETIGVSYA